MRTRQEIKAIGKAQFKANYWPCVGVAFLIPFILNIIPSIMSRPYYSTIINMAVTGSEPTAQQLTSMFSSMALGYFVSWIIILLLRGPMDIGKGFFFIMNVLGNEREATLASPFRSAFTGYGRKLGGYLWKALFLSLWSLIAGAGAAVYRILVGIAVGADTSAALRIILILLGVLILIASYLPAIIKAFSYYMTTYLLADCPNVRAQDALKLSMRIMDGHKWELCVFELSFIGWGILTLFTFGILNIFFVNPYFQSSEATYYLEVREQALRTGVVTMGQLEGVEPV